VMDRILGRLARGGRHPGFWGDIGNTSTHSTGADREQLSCVSSEV
jgi:hypothetical protein